MKAVWPIGEVRETLKEFMCINTNWTLLSTVSGMRISSLVRCLPEFDLQHSHLHTHQTKHSFLTLVLEGGQSASVCI